MAPKPARVHREPLGEHPHVRRHRGHPAEIVDPQCTQPELRPWCRVQHTALLPDELPPLDTSGVCRRSSEQAEGNIVQHTAEHRARRLNVRAPSAVSLLVIPHVHLGGSPICHRQHLCEACRDVGRDDEAGQQEVGAAVVARPLAVVALDRLVEREPLLRGLQWVAGLLGLVRHRALPSSSSSRTEDAVACIRVHRGVEVEHLALLLAAHNVEGPDLLSGHLVREQVLHWLRLDMRVPSDVHAQLRARAEVRI
mmetsp:Transcript_109043/g.315032  ORF Transcript_109043/g.315032 Transcript_109043/m.315032 type:complete len:253 (-) Transcript_109043:258-1016(-)